MKHLLGLSPSNSLALSTSSDTSVLVAISDLSSNSESEFTEFSVAFPGENMLEMGLFWCTFFDFYVSESIYNFN